MVKQIIPENYQQALVEISKEKMIKFAGGTDLMIQKRSWAGIPPHFEHSVIYLSNLKELQYINLQIDGLHIGAMTPMETILNHPATPPFFKEILIDIASPGIRYLATLAGNIANASPAGDSLIGLYLLDAKVVLENLHHQRIIPIEEIIIAPRITTIKDDELIKEIWIPKCSCTHKKWVKVGGRKADAISKVSFGGLAYIKNNFVIDFRIAIGAVYKTIIRDHAFEKELIGLDTKTLIQKQDMILSHYKSLIKPIDDQRSNKEYREQVALNLIKDFLTFISK